MGIERVDWKQVQDWLGVVWANLGWIVFGVAGRLIFHSREVQAGRRKFWGRDLVFELPQAVFMSFVGKALAVWLNLSPEATSAVIGVAAYLGPRAIDSAFGRWAKASSPAGQSD